MVAQWTIHSAALCFSTPCVKLRSNHDKPTLEPAKQPKVQSNVHNPHSLNDMPDQTGPNSSSLSGFMRERPNLPGSYPYRPAQTVGLSFSPVGLTSSPVDDSSTFPLRHQVPRRDLTRKIVLSTDDTSYQQLLISLHPGHHDSLVVLPLQLSKMMLMTSSLTLPW